MPHIFAVESASLNQPFNDLIRIKRRSADFPSHQPRCCGLSGKSFIPMLSSFACAVPGIMATRVIENERDRLATILAAPLMTCSARLPVYALLIAAFIPEQAFLGGLVTLQGLTLAGLYLLGIVTAVVAVLVLKRTVLRGQSPPFVMELPSYQWPSPRTVLLRVMERAWVFPPQSRLTPLTPEERGRAARAARRQRFERRFELLPFRHIQIGLAQNCLRHVVVDILSRQTSGETLHARDPLQQILKCQNKLLPLAQ